MFRTRMQTQRLQTTKNLIILETTKNCIKFKEGCRILFVVYTCRHHNGEASTNAVLSESCAVSKSSIDKSYQVL